MIHFRVIWRLKVRMKRSPLLSCPSYWGSCRGRRRMWPQCFYWVFWALGSRVLQHHHHPQSSRARSRSRCLTAGSELNHNYNKTSVCETRVTGNTHKHKTEPRQTNPESIKQDVRLSLFWLMFCSYWKWFTNACYSEENNMELFHTTVRGYWSKMYFFLNQLYTVIIWYLHIWNTIC